MTNFVDCPKVSPNPLSVSSTISTTMRKDGEPESCLNVACRTLLHLLPYARYEHERFCPREMMQKGIADSLGVCRPFVSRQLNRLVEEGFLMCMEKHAFTSKREEKAYVPTERGVKAAIEIRTALKALAEARNESEGLGESPAQRDARAQAAGS